MLGPVLFEIYVNNPRDFVILDIFEKLLVKQKNYLN